MSESTSSDSVAVPPRLCQWRPGRYSAVLVVNVTATILLFPLKFPECMFRSESLEGTNLPVELNDLRQMKLYFPVLQLASLGCGLIAAFLVRRADASAHVRSACGYAIINWFQSILASNSLFLKDPANCVRYSFGADDGNAHAFFAVCRGVLYAWASLWMQVLIASRLDLLERSSNQKYCGSFVRKLIWVQAFSALAAGLICGTAIARSESFSLPQDSGFLATSFALTSFYFLCNLVGSIVAVCSIARSLLHLGKVLRLAKLQGIPLDVKSSLTRARRLAALQVLGVSFSLILTVAVVPVAYLHMVYKAPELAAVCVFVQAADCLGNAIAVLLLSGSHRFSKVISPAHSARESQRVRCCGRHGKAVPRKEAAWSVDWKAKVEELSTRGMTLRSLVRFCEELSFMPESEWTYVPHAHKTRDVVRRVIIPLTCKEESSYAASSLNCDGAQRAEIMVTHNWGNSFNDLLAAVVSDALQECSFKMVAQLLQDDVAFIEKLLGQSGRLDATYWICAFAVNQHASICHCNPYDRDPLTGKLHPVCSCSSVNISDPDGRSTSSEINKFDDMMYHLATTGTCRQVIAVDKSLDLFHRAWCMAEIAEAKRLEMTQSLQLLSKATMQQRARTLEGLDVRDMSASCDKDKELILSKIEDIDEFNVELQGLIFDPKSGLVTSWNAMDSSQQLGEVGRLIRWGLADAGTGTVWRAWDAHASSEAII